MATEGKKKNSDMLDRCKVLPTTPFEKNILIAQPVPSNTDADRSRAERPQMLHAHQFQLAVDRVIQPRFTQGSNLSS